MLSCDSLLHDSCTDDERLDVLLDNLERKHPDPPASSSSAAGSEACFGNENAAPRNGAARMQAHACGAGGATKHDPLASINEELRRARSGVAGLERRLRQLHAH